jgi:hypothetical protein
MISFWVMGLVLSREYWTIDAFAVASGRHVRRLGTIRLRSHARWGPGVAVLSG